MLDEGKVQEMEQRTPELAQAAVRRAYQASLAAGNTVTVRRGQDIVQVMPNGVATFVKRARPLTPVRPGTRVRLW